MPPKKEKKGGKKGRKSKKDDAWKAAEKQNEPETTEKEIMMTSELETLTQELENAKKRVFQLREENGWLQEEAQKVRMENHEYMAYMEKKTNKRQTAIISLSDHQQKEIEDLRIEKQRMIDEFNAKKQTIMESMMQKENVLSKINREIEDLHEYKVLQEEQSSRIKELEMQITSMRKQHSDAVQQMKSRFLNEKRECEISSEIRVAEMSKQANQEAAVCLSEHTEKVRVQNQQLRQELLMLIRKTQALYEHKRHLEEQKQQLLTERQYAEDLKSLRVEKKLASLSEKRKADDGQKRITIGKNVLPVERNN